MDSVQQFAELPEGLVQLRFSDENGNVRNLNAAEVAETLQGLVEFTSQMARNGLFGDGPPPELRVRPPKAGSFIIETLVQWAGANPEAAWGTAMTAGGALAQGINVGLRRLRGEEPSDFDYLENGDVKITWPGKGVDQIPSKVWDQLRSTKRPTRKALRKIMSPLGDDAEMLEVRDGSVNESTEKILDSPPQAVASRSDYRAANQEIVDESENVTTFNAEAQLRSIDFRPGEKWRVQTLEGTRQAAMDDEEFMLQLDRGMALHKNDIFDVTIREVATTKNGRTTRAWSLIRVTRKRQGVDDDESTIHNPEHGEQERGL